MLFRKHSKGVMKAVSNYLFFQEKCICSKHQVLLYFNLSDSCSYSGTEYSITPNKSCSVPHLLNHIKAPLHEHIQLDFHSIDHVHSEFHSADPKQKGFSCVILHCSQNFPVSIPNNLKLQTEGGSWIGRICPKEVFLSNAFLSPTLPFSSVSFVY